MKEKDTVFERKSVGGLCLKIHDTHTVSKGMESRLHKEMKVCTPDEILKVNIHKKKRIKFLEAYLTRLQDDCHSFQVQHQDFFNGEERK